MDIGAVIEQTARILWKHKFLAVFSMLEIILTGSGLFAREVLGWFVTLLTRLSPEFGEALRPLGGRMPGTLISLDRLGELYRLVAPYGAAGWAGLIGGVVLLLIAVAVVGIVIEGGIIAAVGEIAQGRPTGSREVFAAGWRRVLPMVVIASVSAIPLTLGAILVVGIGTAMTQGAGGLEALMASPDQARQVLAVLFLISLVILSPMAVITPPLTLMSVMAYRACMLEGLNAIASFRRAWAVLRAQLGWVLLLVAIGYGVSLLANTIVYIPTRLAVIFPPAVALAWPVVGVARAFYLALWTLGWRAWTAETGAPGEPARA